MTLLRERGLKRLQEHWLNQAESDLQTVLRQDPNDAAALHFLGVARFKLGQREDGIDMIRRALRTEPDRVLAWLDLAVALRDMGHITPALDAYRHAIDSVSAMRTQSLEPFDNVRFGGSSAYTSYVQLLTVPSRAGAVAPLKELEFSVDRGQYSLKFLDYTYRASVRYGGGRPPHAGLFNLIGSERERYANFIDEVTRLADDFAKIPLQGDYSGLEPFWLNTWFPPLDGMALFGMLRRRKPSVFIEIGSGMSTKFARKAISTFGLETRIISIDPAPRNQIDVLVDETVPAGLEDVDQKLFSQLQANDFLFIDSSHRAFQNSDVTVFFLEILPALNASDWRLAALMERAVPSCNCIAVR